MEIILNIFMLLCTGFIKSSIKEINHCKYNYSIVLILFTSCVANQAKKTEDITNEKMMEYLTSLQGVEGLNNPDTLFSVGYLNVYLGKDQLGNKIMNYALSLRDSLTFEDYHALAVQNIKNGNYSTATSAIEKAIVLNPEVHGYYGWVLLYYFRDYKEALSHLEAYDALTPNFSDAPAGEDIHFLKGLAKMKLDDYTGAVLEFNINIKEVSIKSGEEWVPIVTFFYKARCFQKLGRLQEAIYEYNKAIKYHENYTEALFFRGLTLISLGEQMAGCASIRKSLELRRRGYRQSDPYVELFDEIYMSDIEAAIAEHCK